MLAKLSRRLSLAERDACEGVLTIEECFHALQGMPHRKTLGSGLALIMASLKECGLAPGRIVPTNPTVLSGLNIFCCSGRPSTLVIIISQRGNQLLPNLRHAFRAGLGGPCPFKARPLLLTLFLSQIWHLCHVFLIP